MSDGNRENTTASVQIEEIKCAIRALPFVTKLSPVRAHKSHGAGSKEQTTQRISSRKRISTSGLRDLTITVHD